MKMKVFIIAVESLAHNFLNFFLLIPWPKRETNFSGCPTGSQLLPPVNPNILAAEMTGK
jgi:hypothetical protein